MSHPAAGIVYDNREKLEAAGYEFVENRFVNRGTYSIRYRGERIEDGPVTESEALEIAALHRYLGRAQ